MKKRILLLSAIIFMFSSIQAQIIHVPGDYNTIQEGINAASDGDTVLVAENTYFENIKFMGKAITVTSEFILDSNSDHIDNTIIDGSQASNPDSAAVVMFINGEDTTSIINGFTITGGSGVKVNSPWQAIMGGGIFTFNSGAKIINNHIIDNMITHSNYSCGGAGIGSFSISEYHWVVISDNVISGNQSFANSVTSFGGGMYVMNNAMIKNNIVEQNICYNIGTQADGGGIEVEQVEGQDFTVYIANNIVQNNSVDGITYGLGGGISCLHVSNIYIMHNTIIENTSTGGELAYGGGIYAANTGNLIQMSNNTIENNSCNATNSYGGGFTLYECGKSIITNNAIKYNSLIAENYTLGGGGNFRGPTDTLLIQHNNIIGNSNGGTGWGGGIGIYSLTFSVVYFDRNILSNNYSTQNGGGLWTYNTYGTYVINNVFDNNEANGLGGAISFRQNLGKAENIIFPNSFTELEKDNVTHGRDDIFHPIIANNNFISNIASRGGAIDSDHGLETPIIFNSIFWENTATNGQDIYNQSASNMYLHNNNVDASLISTPWEGDNNINEDPEFIDTLYHISDISPCFNTGIDIIEIDELTYYCPEEDFEGEPRPLYGSADIGADEVFIEGIINHFSSSISNLNLKNYPNPFTSSTTIEFHIPSSGYTSLKLYDLLGKEVGTLLSEELLQGKHTVEWNAPVKQPGIYYLKISFKGQTEMIKILHLQ